MILGYGFWQRLGGRSDVIGQTLLLDDVPTTIVGVMPRDFRIELFNNPGRDLPSGHTRSFCGPESRVSRVSRDRQA